MDRKKLEKIFEDAADTVKNLVKNAADDLQESETEQLANMQQMLFFLASAKGEDDEATRQQMLQASAVAPFLMDALKDQKSRSMREQIIKALPMLPFLAMSLKGLDSKTQREKVTQIIPVAPFVLPSLAPVAPLVPAAFKLREENTKTTQIAVELYAELDENLKLNEKMLQKMSATIQSISKDELRSVLKKGQTRAKIANQLIMLGRILSIIPEDAFQDASGILSDTLPKGLKKGMGRIESNNAGTETISPEELAGRAWGKFKSAVAAEQSSEKTREPQQPVESKTPIDVLTDATYDTLQKCTPEALGILLTHIRENISAADLAALGTSGRTLASDLAKRKKHPQEEHEQNVAEFSAALGKTLQIIEDAMDKAGIMRSADVTALQNNYEEAQRHSRWQKPENASPQQPPSP